MILNDSWYGIMLFQMQRFNQNSVFFWQHSHYDHAEHPWHFSAQFGEGIVKFFAEHLYRRSTLPRLYPPFSHPNSRWLSTHERERGNADFDRHCEDNCMSLSPYAVGERSVNFSWPKCNFFYSHPFIYFNSKKLFRSWVLLYSTTCKYEYFLMHRA